MLINRGYVFRMYPNEEQKVLINKTIGCARFVYNYYLDKKIKGYKETKHSKSKYDCCNDLKKLEVTYPYLKEVDSCALRNSIFSLDDAFHNFCKNNMGYPKFKARGIKDIYKTNNFKRIITNSYVILLNMTNHTITLPKVGEVPIRGYRHLTKIDGEIKSATIKKVAGKYYVSILVEESIPMPTILPIKNMVGIDLGIKDYVVTSHNEKIKNTVHINEKRLAGLQKALARTQKQSKNREKLKLKIERLFQKIKNAKKHLIYNIANYLIKENDFIATETLDIQKMKQNHSVAKALTNINFYELIRVLKYKCYWLGKEFIQVPKYYASSQICSNCGYKNELVKDLSIREWTCPKCGSLHNRDYNASVNIRDKGYQIYLDRCKI